MKESTSKETQEQALKVAKATSKPGQSKDQTKLIAQGIEKGIAEYKKQQKVKARERDKVKKKRIKASSNQQIDDALEPSNQPKPKLTLPWGLLLASWLIFAGYHIGLGAA